MKEIYSTFDGKLNVEQRKGYVISLTDTDKLQIEYLNVALDCPDKKYLLTKTKQYNEETDWNFSACAECTYAIHNGQIDGYEMVDGKWKHNNY